MYCQLYLIFSSVIFLKSPWKTKGQINPEVENHLRLGEQLLAQGLYNDALSHYHAAVDGDPENYLTYFKRATIYYALTKIASALRDLSKAIEMRPQFITARIQRGSILLKQGRLDEAHVDFEHVLRLDPMNAEAQNMYSMIEQLRTDLFLAYEMFEDRNYHEAIDLLSRLLHELPWDAKLREMRSECFEAIGDIVGAINDLKPIVKTDSHNQERYLKLSQLYYHIGETEDALNAIRDCLKFDPDHKACFVHYKHIKKIAAHLSAMQEHINNGQYLECAERLKKALPLETNVHYIRQYIRSRLCLCLNKAGQPSEAITMCTEALRLNPSDLDTLCERAEAHLANDNYDQAIRDYHDATNIDETSRRAHEGLKRAQKLQKQSQKRDYYKILGVRRTAGKREILKAYRKLAQKWHPDNFQGDEKKSAEKKFIDIAAAKEVLTDPEKREKYDNGEDPLDPESQAGQNFNPFTHGFNFGHGQSYTYKFHFS